MSRLLGRLSDFGNNLAELVAPLDEENDDFEADPSRSGLHEGLIEYEESEEKHSVSGNTADAQIELLTEQREGETPLHLNSLEGTPVLHSLKAPPSSFVLEAPESEADVRETTRTLAAVEAPDKILEDIQEVDGVHKGNRHDGLPVDTLSLHPQQQSRDVPCTLKVEQREQSDSASIVAQRQWELKLASKEHEIGSLKEVISQLRRSKSSKMQEVDAGLKERDELRVKVADLMSHHKRQENLQAREEDARTSVAVLESKLAEHLRQGRESAATIKDLASQLHLEKQQFEKARQSEHASHSQLQVVKADLDVALADRERALSGMENLQHAIENFQAERDVEIAQIISRRTRELEAANEALLVKIEHLKVTHKEVQGSQCEEMAKLQSELADAQHALSGLADVKETEISRMRRSLDLAIEQLQVQTEDVVDRSLVRNLLLQYFAKGKSAEVLELFTNILGFNDDDKQKVGLHPRGKGLLHQLIAPLPPPELSAEEVEGSNLVELWVAFLEKETSPCPER
jgi:hypothetical protein